MPVEDKAAWARADTTGDVKGASVVLKRRDNGEEITLPQAEFAKLALTTYSEMDDVVDDLTQVRRRAGCVCAQVGHGGKQARSAREAGSRTP